MIESGFEFFSGDFLLSENNEKEQRALLYSLYSKKLLQYYIIFATFKIMHALNERAHKKSVQKFNYFSEVFGNRAEQRVDCAA